MKNDFVLIPISKFNALYDHLCAALTEYETSDDARQLYENLVSLQYELDTITED